MAKKIYILPILVLLFAISAEALAQITPTDSLGCSSSVRARQVSPSEAGYKETGALKAREDSVATAEVVDSVATESPFKRFLKKTKKLILQTVKDLDESDSIYIEPNHYDWTVMLQNTNFFQFVTFSATDPVLGKQSLSFSPRTASKIGPYIGWKWIFLGYTFGLTDPKGNGEMTELSLSIYTNKVGGDIIYLKNTKNFRIRRISGFPNVNNSELEGTNFDGLSTYTLSVNAYYVFNNKKFSYPAAYNQSTQQKRSAGSFLLGFRYDHQRFKFDYKAFPDKLIYDENGKSLIDEELMFDKITYSSYCINGGYAYNWVFSKNWLLAASLTPSIGIKLLKGEQLSSKTFVNGVKNFRFDLVGRAGIVRNNSRFFAGASFVTHFYNYRRKNFSISNSVNYLNIYAGVNFYPKKRYR